MIDSTERWSNFRRAIPTLRARQRLRKRKDSFEGVRLSPSCVSLSNMSFPTILAFGTRRIEPDYELNFRYVDQMCDIMCLESPRPTFTAALLGQILSERSSEDFTYTIRCGLTINSACWANVSYKHNKTQLNSTKPNYPAGRADRGTRSDLDVLAAILDCRV